MVVPVVFPPVGYRTASSMLLVLERKKDIGKSSLSSPCLLQGSIQHATGAQVSVTCYWILSVDRHFFLAPSFGKSLDWRCQVTYTRRLPEDFSGSWTVPVMRKEKRGQRKRAQRKRQHSKAAQQAPHTSSPGRPRQGKRKPGSRRPERHRHTPAEPAPPTVCNFCLMLGPRVGALCILALTGALLVLLDQRGCPFRPGPSHK